MNWQQCCRLYLSLNDAENTNYAIALSRIFSNLVYPDISLIAKDSKTIYVPEQYHVKVDGQPRVYTILKNPAVFHSMPLELKIGFLDVLYLILRRGVYDVIRLQSWMCNVNNPQYSYQENGNSNAKTLEAEVISSFDSVTSPFMQYLINLLPSSNSNNNLNVPVCVSKRIIRLLGVIGSAGVSVADLSSYLHLLRFPSELSTPLLQSLYTMMKQDVAVLKAYPSAMFSFGGPGAGIYTAGENCPFHREMQFFTWFRFESFDTEVNLSTGGSPERCSQHIFKLLSSSGKGWDIYLEDRYLSLLLSYGYGSDPFYIRLDQVLRRGVWYHICIKHSRPPRLSIFARDEIAVYLDHVLIFQDSQRFPAVGGEANYEIICAKNFDGQMSPVFILNESIPQAAVETIAKIDSGKVADSGASKDLHKSMSLNYNTSVDLMASIPTPDKKLASFSTKITTVYHPNRCIHGFVLDIHHNNHGKLGSRSFPWQIKSVKDVLASIGGLPVILPLLPRLFVENEVKRNEVMALSGSAGLGTSLGDVQTEKDVPLLIDTDSLEALESDMQDQYVEGSLCLVFSILAVCLSSDRGNQKQIGIIGGFDMIEYALRCVSNHILQTEGETCVLSLLSLRTSVADNLELDESVLSRLLCNFDVWSRASYKFQSSLMSVLLASIRSQPSHFLSIIGVQGVLDGLMSNYMELPAVRRDSKGNTATTNAPVRKESEDISSPKALTSTKPNMPNLVTAETNVHDPSPSPMISPSLIRSPAPTPSNARQSFAKHKSSFASTSFKVALNMELCTDLRGNSSDSDDDAMQIHDDVSLSSGNTQSDIHTSIINAQTGINISDLLSQSNTSLNIDNFTRKSPLRRLTENQMDNTASDHRSYLNKSRKSFIMITEDTINQADSIVGDASTIPEKILEAVETEDEDAGKDEISASYIESEIEILTPTQRKHIRSCLYTMITTLVLHSPTEKEIRPILDFMAVCKNSEILHETAQLLLCLLVEGGAGVMIAITTATRGPEEFASFVIFHLIHQSAEDVRCAGIRLLTHFYVRLDLLPANVLTLALKRRKGSILSRTIESLAVSISSNGGYHSIHRLVACGGLALLIEIITSHSRNCTELTYAALLEMLLTKAGARSQVTIKYTDLFQGTTTSADVVHHAPSSSPVSTSSTGRDGINKNSFPNANATGAFLLHTNAGTVPMADSPHNRPLSVPFAGYDKGYLAHRSVVFSAHYLSPDLVHDEGTNMINSEVLPVFFEALPKIPLKLHDQIYNDLLALLKHSSGNRDAFVGNPLWHVCMFEMVYQLVRVSNHSKNKHKDYGMTSEEGEVIHVEDILAILESWSISESSISQSVSLSKGKTIGRSASYSVEKQDSLTQDLKHLSPLGSKSLSFSKDDVITRTINMTINTAAWSSQSSPKFDNFDTEFSLDTKFSIGMKVFATLLMHCLDRKSGWKALEATISQSYDDEVAYNAAQAVLSHMTSELTFNMRSKYRDLQRLAKSTNYSETTEALDKLENLLCVMLISSQFALLDEATVLKGVPDYEIAQRRLAIYNEISKDDQNTSDGLFAESLESPMMRRGPSRDTMDVTSSLSVDDMAAVNAIDPSHISQSLHDNQDILDGKTNAEIAPSRLDLCEERLMSEYRMESENYTNILQDIEKQYTASNVDDISTRDNLISFSHVWFDFAKGFTSFSPMNSPTAAKMEPRPHLATNNDTTATSHNLKRLSSRKQEQIFARDGHLHPLERGHSQVKGKLVLVLQTLRFFDAIFWPNESGSIRNSQMLKFQTEKPVTTSTSTGQPGNSMPSMNRKNAATSANQSANGAAATATETSSQPNLTLYSGSMRMCLYILTNLSPLTDLASLNILRIKALVDVVDKVSSHTSPVNDWILVLVLHLTLTVQRIINSFEPLFQYLGLKSSHMSIPSMAVRDNPFEFAERSRINEDEIILERALNDPELSLQLQNLFDNLAGRQLLLFVKNCLIVLTAIFDSKKVLLAQALEDRTMYWYDSLIEKLKCDLQLVEFDESSHHNTATSTNSTDIPIQREKSNKIPMKWKVSSQSIRSEEANSGRIRSSSDYSTTMSHLVTQQRVRAATQLDQTILRPLNDNTSETASEMSDSRVDSSNDDTNRSSTDNKSGRLGLGGMYHAKANSMSDLLEGSEDNRILARDVVTMLAWFREPYFRCNLLRSMGLVKALIALDYHETICEQTHRQELESIRQSLKEERDQGSKVIEEMMELKEVSSIVTNMMKGREGSRARSKRAVEALRLKQVASSWQECIHNFESDWSPWYNQEYTDHAVPGKAYYELTRLKDTRMRRMILTRLPESIDTSHAAYTEGKLRDQQLFEAIQSKSLPIGSQNPSLDPSTAMDSIPMSFLKPEMYKMLTSLKKSPSNWDDDEDEEEMMDSFDELDANGLYQKPNPSIEGKSLSAPTSSNIASVIGGAKNLVMNPFFSSSNLERPLWSYAFHWESDEKVQLIMDATQIQLQQTIKGTLLLTNKYLYFHPKTQTGGLGSASNAFYDLRWHLDRLVETYGRRYLLQSCAIELFFLDAVEIFFAFKTLKEVKLFYSILRRQNTSLHSVARTLNPRSLCQQSPWTDLWRKRQISNFEYLMRLNIISGRSYNDITQYPVFPWVLADYHSNKLDLSNENSYRDLRKPVGALNATRLTEFLDRYKSFDDDDEVPRFMYGSHYSSAGVVLHYLIRQEPFTTMGINLQGGRFDCPDRIFFDLHRTWQGCNTSMSDVKELIPEFFCCPEMFLNTNKLNLGELQEGGYVSDVILPPWASDAFDFIRIHREALESEYVSERLNDWIDLIFGYKQTGQAAIQANNVFYYLTYENAINIDAIEDPLQKEATKAQVIHFGQTPSQLFIKEHPKRLPRRECLYPLCSDFNQLSSITTYTPKQYGMTNELEAVIAIQCTSDRLIVVHADMTVAYYRWNTFMDSDGNPFQLKMDRKKVLSCENISCSLEMIQKRRKPLNDADRNNSSSNFDDQITNSSKLRSISTNSSSYISRQELMNLEDSETSMTSSIASSMPSTVAETSTATNSSIFGSMFRFRSTSSTPTSSSMNSSSFASFALSTMSSKDPTAPTTASTAMTSTLSSSAINSDIANELKSISSSVTSCRGHSLGMMLFESFGNKQIAITLDDANYGRIISCGYWDAALKVHALDTLKDIGSVNNGHMGQITCVQVGYQGGLTILSGGDDGTCRVWIVENPTLAMSYSDKRFKDQEIESNPQDAVLQCVRVLWGHTSSITDLSYSSELDIVLSSSTSGLLCLHTVRQGTYLRSIKTMLGHNITKVLVSTAGYLIAHSKSHMQLHLFWINGQHLATSDLTMRVDAMCVNGSGTVLVCGMSGGSLSLRALWNLDELHVIDTLRVHRSITALWFTEDFQYLLIGSEDGTFSIATDSEGRWKNQSQA